MPDAVVMRWSDCMLISLYAQAAHDWYESIIQRAASYEKERYEESLAVAY